uniref:OTU domain-containing protein n=1 Tax=Branchiostoma floridae TaxID=7739 RepID=C3YIW5_BRAFL|eukprot:XP_002603828.1 hypothetical protein BRAFLDRAFT_101331 [Branchiostoma floridae]
MGCNWSKCKIKPAEAEAAPRSLPNTRLASRARKQARKLQARIAKCFQRREKNVKKVVGSAPCNAEETSPDKVVEDLGTVPHLAKATDPIWKLGVRPQCHTLPRKRLQIWKSRVRPQCHILLRKRLQIWKLRCTATVPHIAEETSPDMEVEGTATVPHIAEATSPEMEVEGTATVPHIAEAKDPNTVSHSNKVPDPNLEIEDPGQTQHPVEATDMKIVLEDPDPRMVAEDTTTEHSRRLRRSISVGQLSFRHKRKSIFKSRSDRLLLEERIASLGYERDRVPGDGNCFFWAAARQLCRGQPRVTTTAQELRQDLVKYIKSQADFYIPFLVGGPKAFWKQLDKLSVEGQWSTDLADALPHALANFTSRSVILITSKPNQPTISITPDSGNESGTPVVLSYSARWGVEHYDAVIQKNEERSDPEHGSTAI